MEEHERRLYVAYGSNLNRTQMALRCPTAKVVGASVIHNHRLRFRGDLQTGLATIEPFRGGSVPVLIWELQAEDEMTLDIYEGWPHLYRKEMVQVEFNGAIISAMTYIMNGAKPYVLPSLRYLNTIREGYQSAEFDTAILYKAALDSTKTQEDIHMDRIIRDQILAVRNSGETNMFDINVVIRIAMREGFCELIAYLPHHKAEYVRFIITGETDNGHAE